MSDLPAKKPEITTAPAPSYANITEGYQTALKVVDDVILKNYITDLSHMEIVPLSSSVLQSNIRDNVRFFKITEMVYEKEEFATYKFASVFNALSITDSAVFIIIDSDGVKTDFYMGVRSLDEYRTISSLKNTVENAMKGQFPGIKTAPDYTIEEMESILAKIKANSISAVSCVANNKAHDGVTNQSFVQGLEKLVLSMQGEKYTGIIIANGTTQIQLRDLRKGYEAVYTQLSAFASTQVNYTGNNSFNYSVAETKGNSHAKTHSDNWSETNSQSKTEGSSTSYSESRGDVVSKTIGGVASAASILGAALAPVTGGASLAVGGVVSSGLGMLGSAISKNVSDSTSANESVTNSFSTVRGSSDGTTDTVNYGISKTEGYTKGISEGMTLTLHDKSIEDTLERINKQLKRIDEFESLGMYECAAYFLSEDQYAAEVAASTYKALMRGENSGVEIAAINSWGQYQKDKTQLIGQYVKNFIHPVFRYNGAAGNIEVTPCSLVSGNELAIHMGLPRRSVCGLPVIEHADFGKEIVTYDGAERSSGINLGNIFNMGSVCSNKVSLNINSLAMHTFVTGSTGSGKSNTVYEMVRQLDNFGINFLIIEPAKGEYKNVFGHRRDVFVYGTNPRLTPLLRINPFRFPAEQIHIYEHMDKLTEIFNVCWPMYAAMPAVLKAAIENAYKSAGWDLMKSENKHGDIFPTFKDVADEVEKYINQSEYSDENKSNYKGSLLTRLESLTNGINSMIFSNDDIEDEKLFDRNVIVDLSRVGSSETKSLIMGMLILKLQEYRISKAEGMNQGLRHITVLEEAHNILKKTSTEQSAEEANLAGKSVEMLANSIAEMRTYGEGFIIADQAPGLLDPAVIRNTNTKIILRLPEFSDRELVGKAAALNDEQIIELAKLPKGVAAVYQNDWIDPVLCKIDKFEVQEKEYCVPESTELFDNGKKASTILINFVARNLFDNPDAISDKQIRWAIEKCQCTAKVKTKLYMMLEEYRQNHKLSLWQQENFSKQAFLVQDILCLDKAVESARQMSMDFNGFNCYLNTLVAQRIEKASDNLIINIDHCLLKAYSEMKADGAEYYKNWYKKIAERGYLM